MDKLLRDIRDACPSGLWSRGVRLSRGEQVVVESKSDDEIVMRIISPGRRVEPTVVLYPADRDWECDCGSKFDACEHVAAAILSLGRSAADGAELATAAPDRAGTISYSFERRRGQMHLRRQVKSASGETAVLRRSVSAIMSGLAETSVKGLVIKPDHADLEADAALGPHPTELLGARVASKLCRALAGHARVTLDGEAVSVSSDPIAPVALLTAAGSDVILTIDRAGNLDEVLAPGLGLAEGTIRPLAATAITGTSLEQLPLRRRYRAGELGELVGEMLPRLNRELGVSIAASVALPDMIDAGEPRIDLGLRQADGSVEVLPRLIYGTGAAPIARVDGDKLVHLRGGVPRRDLGRERELVAALRSELNLVCNRSVGFRGAEAADFLRRQRDSSFAENAEQLAAARPLEARVVSVGGRVEIHFVAIGDDGREERAEPGDVMAAWDAGNQLAPLGAGGFGRIPADWLEVRADLVRDLLAASGETDLRAAAAGASLAIEHGVALPADLQRLRPLFGDFDSLPGAAMPADFTGELRDYQQTGHAWLSFLGDAGLGALLADDMGLGKTIQVLCAIRRPALVIAPTSTLPNWRREIERFRPTLRTCVFHGAGRVLEDDADITLTSYALLRRDIELLAAREWELVVLDEAQAIKNPDSQAARASRRLRAGARIALSGTPIENRLDELWSISEFLNPGLLRSRSEFDAELARPIADGDARALERLRQLLRPVVLRRRKREVATELPPRVEVVDACALSTEEREIYDAVRAAARADVTRKLEAGGSPLAALTALLRLRQAACHTGLLPGRTAQSSSKLERLCELLDTAVADEHKALVFSQWTSLLDLIEPALRALDIDFVRLDGSTRDRGAVVDAFQAEGGPPVMLISLKAGGTGLNLTAADHVFLLDPWWNPAVEAQAADRAHRIGQTRPVLIHRMVAADTVEERVLELQQRKRALAESALGGDVGAGASMTRDDLLALLD